MAHYFAGNDTAFDFIGYFIDYRCFWCGSSHYGNDRFPEHGLCDSYDYASSPRLRLYPISAWLCLRNRRYSVLALYCCESACTDIGEKDWKIAADTANPGDFCIIESKESLESKERNGPHYVTSRQDRKTCKSLQGSDLFHRYPVGSFRTFQRVAAGYDRKPGF